MRRRRQKNNLLPKMIVAAVVVNVILLPILAQLGVFKIGHGQRLTPIELVKLPPEKKPVEPKKQAKKRVAKAKIHAARKVSARIAAAHPSRPNPNQPKVVASASGPANGPAIENNGTGVPGQVTPPPPTAPSSPPVTAPPPTLPVSPTPPKVAETSPPAPPHIPALIPAEPISQPHPALPDDLREEDLQATFQALFTIRADGTASVKMVSSTGNTTLDTLALQAARQWTFHPATRDGVPVESYRRLTIEFEVS